MVVLTLRTHPDVLFAYSTNYTELILRVENPGKKVLWAEADVNTPEGISLGPTGELRKGRVRIGIVEKDEFLEKAVRLYSTSITSPRIYRCNITLYCYNKDGVIEKRLEKALDVRCELKKPATL